MAAAVGCAHAQSIKTLDPVVVTAGGFEQSLSDVIPSVSVITREQIDRSGALSLADLVMGEPGVEVGRNGGLGTTTSFFLRGAESKNVLVLVDGVRMRDGVTQSALAENIPLGLIEQVEIIRGNVSAIYGDAAVGGIISIKTRRGDGKPRVFVTSSIGERNTRDLTTGYSGSVDGLSFSLTAQHTKTDGFSAIDTQKTAAGTSNDADRDPYENNALGVRISQTIGDLEVGGGALATRASLSFDSAFTSAFTRVSDPSQEASNDLVNVYVQKMFSQDWTSRLDLSRNRIALRYNYDTTNPTTVLNDFRLSNIVRLDSRRSLRFGLDRREETRSPADNSLASRDFTSPYMGYLLSAGRWSGQFNARYDAASVGESKGTWLIGAGYQLSSNVRATASASTAFRFPDSFALSTNSSLSPESHESREVGLVYETALTSLRATIFMSETKDPITFNSSFVAQNANFMKNRGLELYGRILLSSKTKVRVGFVVQDPESPIDSSSTTAIRVQSARRAKVHGSVGVTHSLGSTELAATVQGASRRRDTDFDSVGIYKLPGYAMLNLRGQVKISKELSLSARLDNALDKRYELAHGYNTAPRTLFIGLQFQPAL